MAKTREIAKKKKKKNYGASLNVTSQNIMLQKTIAMITPTGFSIISHKGNYIFYTKA